MHDADRDRLLYHLTPEDELRKFVAEGRYRPASLLHEGFVHCARAASVVAIGNDFFRGTGHRVLVLEIDPERLDCEIRFEAPAPLAGGATHLAGVVVFPHVYGAIALAAIQRVGTLTEHPGIGFRWPEDWQSFQRFLV